MKTLYKYFKPNAPTMIIGLILKFSGAITDLMIPYYLAKILDVALPQVLEMGLEAYLLTDLWPIWKYAIIMIICALLSVAFNITSNYCAAQSSGRITKSLRHDLFAKITYLSEKNTDKFSLPTLISRLTSDTYNVNRMLARIQRMGVRAPIILIGGIIITFTMDPVLTLVLVSTLPFISLLVYTISKKGIPIYSQAQGKLDKTIRVAEENITGIRVIKSLSKAEYEKNRFHEANKELADTEKHASVVMALTNPACSFILNLGLCFVILVGAYRINGGLTGAGTIVAFLNYFTIILNSTIAITNIFIMYTKGAASANRIEEVLLVEDNMPIIESEKVDSPYLIEFDNVSFSHDKVKNNLYGISFGIKKGETLGIIGPTGSGKTTIVRLLLRFYDPDSGTIRIDGQDIRSIKSEDFRKKFGTVFQNDFIYSDTLDENILFGREIDEENKKTAIATAQADEFIKSYDDGLEHMVAIRGANLSGGQKQRVFLARALANRPEILILDDSSSALDYKTDSNFRKELNENYKGVTSIVVAQRVSTIMNAEHILVIDKGNMIGYGTHEELLKNCSYYKDIADIQIGGALNG